MNKRAAIFIGAAIGLLLLAFFITSANVNFGGEASEVNRSESVQAQAKPSQCRFEITVLDDNNKPVDAAQVVVLTENDSTEQVVSWLDGKSSDRKSQTNNLGKIIYTLSAGQRYSVRASSADFEIKNSAPVECKSDQNEAVKVDIKLDKRLNAKEKCQELKVAVFDASATGSENKSTIINSLISITDPASGKVIKEVVDDAGSVTLTDSIKSGNYVISAIKEGYSAISPVATFCQAGGRASVELSLGKEKKAFISPAPVK